MILGTNISKFHYHDTIFNVILNAYFYVAENLIQQTGPHYKAVLSCKPEI